jgi:hypothetical protein
VPGVGRCRTLHTSAFSERLGHEADSVARRSFSRPKLAAAATLATWLSLSGSVAAQTSEATRAAARQLATEGVNNFEAGEFTTASDKLNRAFETIRAPSLGLWSARALARCGRLVQASERYLEVMRLDPRNGDEVVQRQAKLDAEREHSELEPRIARLTLAVFNTAPDADVEVTLDGVVLPQQLLRAQIPADPGEHVIEARQGALYARQPVRLAEGARVNVSLQLTLSAPAALATPPSAPRAAAARPSAVVAPQRAPLALWLTLSGAGVGLAVGSITGVMAIRAREPIAPHCPNDVCDPRYASDVERLDTLRTTSTIAFAVGGVGLAAAGVLWLTSPRPRAPTRAFVRPHVAVGRVGVEGAF